MSASVSDNEGARRTRHGLRTEDIQDPWEKRGKIKITRAGGIGSCMALDVRASISFSARDRSRPAGITVLIKRPKSANKIELIMEFVLHIGR